MLLFSLFCCHKNKIKGQRTHRKNSALFDFPLQTSWNSQYILVIHIRHNVGNGTTQANEEHGGRPGKKKKKTTYHTSFWPFQCGPEISQCTLQIYSVLHQVYPFFQIFLTVPDFNPKLSSCSLPLPHDCSNSSFVLSKSFFCIYREIKLNAAKYWNNSRPKFWEIYEISLNIYKIYLLYYALIWVSLIASRLWCCFTSCWYGPYICSFC